VATLRESVLAALQADRVQAEAVSFPQHLASIRSAPSNGWASDPQAVHVRAVLFLMAQRRVGAEAVRADAVALTADFLAATPASSHRPERTTP
jgi:hypothetical protein